jgi:hypothetical protein
VYAASQRRARQPPPAIPARLAPLPLDALAALFHPRAATARAEPVERYRCRRSVVSTLAASGVHDRTWTSLLYPEEMEALAISADDCRYCETTRALGSARGRGEVEMRKHAAIEIGFDPDTFVSTTRVTGLDVVIPSSEVGLLFERADPRNWARPGSDFFKRSETGVWTRDGWQGGRPWPRPDRGQIYEIALAQINPSIAFEIHNILDISGFRNDLAGRKIEEIRDRSGKAASLTLKYEYSLCQNLGSKLGFIWESEGIDIDNGQYQAVATPDGADRWRVSISVEKRLRYTSPQTVPVEINAALNVMAPAFLSLFMHELVYGVLKDMDGGAPPAAAPAPVLAERRAKPATHAKQATHAKPGSRKGRRRNGHD